VQTDKCKCGIEKPSQLNHSKEVLTGLFQREEDIFGQAGTNYVFIKCGNSVENGEAGCSSVSSSFYT